MERTPYAEKGDTYSRRKHQIAVSTLWSNCREVMPSDFAQSKELANITHELKRIRLALVALMTKKQLRDYEVMLQTDDLGTV